MVKQCKWVDEVLPKAPWVITEGYFKIYLEFLHQLNIDYVCHDEIPYQTSDTSGDFDDAYAVCKKLGKFKAT